MAQLQLGANFLEFYTPALHTDFFDFVWSLPHKIKRKRNFQEMVMRTYHESLMENEYILDNYKINYLGKNFLKRFIFKSRMILKHKKISLLKPFYDSWGDVVPSLFKIELNKFYCDDIVNNEALLDHQIFNNDNLISFLKNEQNINKPNMSIIFSLYTVSKFIKKYFG
jgi:hypothetical protein